MHPTIPKHLDAISKNPNVKIIVLSSATNGAAQKKAFEEMGYVNDNILFTQTDDFDNWHAHKQGGNVNENVFPRGKPDVIKLLNNLHPEKNSILAYSDDNNGDNLVLLNSEDNLDKYPLVKPPVKYGDTGIAQEDIDYFAIIEVLSTYPKDSKEYQAIHKASQQVVTAHVRAVDEFAQQKKEAFDNNMPREERIAKYGDKKAQELEIKYSNQLKPIINNAHLMLNLKALNQSIGTYQSEQAPSKKKLLAEAVKVQTAMETLLNDPEEVLSNEDILQLNKAASHCHQALTAAMEGKTAAAKKHVLPLAELSQSVSGKPSSKWKAFGASLIAFGGIALAVGGLAVGAIFAIPTFGTSLGAAVAGAAAVLGTTAVVGGALAIHKGQKSGLAKDIHSFKEAISELKRDDSPDEEQPFFHPILITKCEGIELKTGFFGGDG